MDLQAEWQELAAIEAESIGWQPLEPGVYLHVEDENAHRGAGGGCASGGGVAGGVSRKIQPTPV